MMIKNEQNNTVETPNVNYKLKTSNKKKSSTVELFNVDDLEAGKYDDKLSDINNSYESKSKDKKKKKKKDRKVPPPTQEDFDMDLEKKK